MNIKKYQIMNRVVVAALCALLSPLSSLLFSSCSDILETESELVEYEKDNTLNHPTDSVYSVMGIINKMQYIADRVVLLGEVRSDLVSVTDAASSDLKRLAAFDFSQSNKYNQVSAYYAVINNCNYFLNHVDTTLQRRGKNVFANEYAAVKAFRAWTYLELVKAYGEVPLVTTPMMTEREAAAAVAGPRSDIKAVCDYFISDLTPVAYVDIPAYRGLAEDEFFLPIRALLGDLCLWAGRYDEAAHWYSDYLSDKKAPIKMNQSNRSVWTSPTSFTSPSRRYSLSSNEQLSYIPMETRVFDGVISDLPNIFNSTTDNNYYFQLQPSTALRRLSASQNYCMEYQSTTAIDTIYVPHEGLGDNIYAGDLRFCSVFSQRTSGSQDPYSEYSSTTQTIDKIMNGQVNTYRSPMVYLRFAEALNRAGYPQSAMLILKHGLCNENAQKYDSLEFNGGARQYIFFDETLFRREDVVGIHSRGCGDAQCDTLYDVPVPPMALATRQDTIAYQIPLVEDMIINEMALEGCFEGYRFYDLMRVALRRDDPAYLADPVSRRNGEADPALRTLLMTQRNWYLPLPETGN